MKQQLVVICSIYLQEELAAAVRRAANQYEIGITQKQSIYMYNIWRTLIDIDSRCCPNSQSQPSGERAEVSIESSSDHHHRAKCNSYFRQRLVLNRTDTRLKRDSALIGGPGCRISERTITVVESVRHVLPGANAVLCFSVVVGVSFERSFHHDFHSDQFTNTRAITCKVHKLH